MISLNKFSMKIEFLYLCRHLLINLNLRLIIFNFKDGICHLLTLKDCFLLVLEHFFFFDFCYFVKMIAETARTYFICLITPLYISCKHFFRDHRVEVYILKLNIIIRSFLCLLKIELLAKGVRNILLHLQKYISLAFQFNFTYYFLQYYNLINY